MSQIENIIFCSTSMMTRVYGLVILLSLTIPRIAYSQQEDYADYDTQPEDFYANDDTQDEDAYFLDAQPKDYYFDEDALPFHVTHIVSVPQSHRYKIGPASW